MINPLDSKKQDLDSKKIEKSDFHKSLSQNLAHDISQHSPQTPPHNLTKDLPQHHSQDSLHFKVPDDYKINQYFEQMFFIEVDSNRFCTNHTRAMFDENFSKLPFQFSAANLPITNDVEKPQNLKILLEIAKILAKPLGYVRVDLYNVGHRVYVGELTFTPAGGTSRFYPSRYDRIYGDLWRL
ncbi:ATP-grasp fold amidoligase family protein [uncultured Helicobacter sp.]|uniref:ATP-grasp fold amidoligase family protein n=1 Tax=uncultured Helicobacter sp. TaxID=175537 RepID=UPI00374EA232